jgi:hypothetical protein
MRVVAKKTVPYDGVYYKKGQEFDIEDKHFKVLAFIGKIEKAKAKPAPKPKAKVAPTRRTTTQTRVLKAEEKRTENEEDAVTSTTARGQYSRRDMRPES